MTNQEALRTLLKAEATLKSAKTGYTKNPNGPAWRTGLPMLWKVRLALGSTDNGRALAEAHGLLKLTEKGYEPTAPRWREAMRIIDAVEADLYRPPVPSLGPCIRGGKPVLLESPTHNTDGLYKRTGSHYAAFDFGWDAGLTVIAWEKIKVTDQSSAMGADAFYGIGLESDLPFWLGHITRSPATGTVIARGKSITAIAAISGADHGHLGFDGRPLMPGTKDFTWGKPVGRDYTLGGPTYMQQLLKAWA